LVSAAPYSQSRQHREPKKNQETDDVYEERTWREHCTVNDDGIICIPAMAFKKALDRAATVLGMKIPGRGKNTYAKHFMAGVLCENNVPIGIKQKDVRPEAINASSTGDPSGKGKRVLRIYPTIPKWSAEAHFLVLDDIITQEIFRRHLVQAGQFVGVGRFRAERGGTYGRFMVDGDLKWEEINF
jgi:hypothetical protein